MTDLDRWIAENVMGWEELHEGEYYDIEGDFARWKERWIPTVKVRQALEALEVWRSKDGGSERRRADLSLFGSNRDDAPYTSCEIGLLDDPIAYVEHESLAKAICLALKQAKGVVRCRRH